MATRGELIAAQLSVDEIRQHINADSLGYLSLEGLQSAVNLAGEPHCLACFTGQYPVPVQLDMDKLAFERNGQEIDGDSPRLVSNATVHSAPMPSKEWSGR